MRILHVITSLRAGGAEHLLVDLLPKLKSTGHQVDLLLFDGTYTPFYEQLEEQGIEIYSLGHGMYSMYNPLHLFQLKRIMRKYDVVHTHNTPCQLLAAIASGRTPLLVTTEHNTFNRRRTWKGWSAVDRWMYGKYARIVCVSQSTEEKLIDYLQDDSICKRIITIPNGISLERYRNAVPDENLRRQYTGKHIVIMVAAFRQQKDQKTLICAMKQLPETYVLWLVGEGENRYECEMKVASLGLKDRVLFLGNCTNVPSLLAVADIVVMSSHYEGFSLSSIEGMASGKPCIASDVPALSEIVGGAGMLFPCGDACRLSALIQQVCEDKILYQQVTKRCRKRAMRYDILNMVASYKWIYESAIIKMNDL
ncbi:glycosyltransferase [uncultured Parabacteroides sp.]|uniref:glycosyltransferase n=1 Tax=uncultured Parabacteroides sp. TaxID=512312 RepID=UPI00262B5C7D|nr:glycosyltransferase [uncultured Parabacteroides sp.]